MIYNIFYNLYGYNILLFNYINQFANLYLSSNVLHILSWLFDIEMFIFYYFTLIIFSIIFVIYRKSEKEYKILYSLILKMGLCYTVFGITYAILKFGINFPRPFCSLDSFITTIDISKERCLSSFPSSHAGISFITMLLLWDRMNFLSKICALIIVLTVSIARIGFALHYPTDILYSFIIAYLIYLFYLSLYNKIEAVSCKMRDIMWEIFSKKNKNQAKR